MLRALSSDTVRARHAPGPARAAGGGILGQEISSINLSRRATMWRSSVKANSRAGLGSARPICCALCSNSMARSVSARVARHDALEHENAIVGRSGAHASLQQPLDHRDRARLLAKSR